MNKNQKTSILFGEHMVLQRGKPVPVWGKSRPGDRIKVSVQGQEKISYADASGKWMIRLDPLDMSWGETLKVSGEDFEEIFEDVLVGDVWIAAGQSNMEFPMFYEKIIEKNWSRFGNPESAFLIIRKSVMKVS